jgi:phage terminase large subunit-like protein
LLGLQRAALWRLQANPGQLPPPEFGAGARVWYSQGARGSGKTRSGSEAMAELILTSPPGDWACIGPTFGDARDTMIEHRKSGLKRALGPAVTKWNRSNGELYVANGSVVYCDGAVEGAERIQGKELRGAWADEIGLWRATKTRKGEEKGGIRAWKESLVFAVREAPALIIATGTPKGNKGVVKLLRAEPEGRVVFTRPRLEHNRRNLEPSIVEEWERLYAGTRLGKQELEGIVLEDVEGALWTLQLIEELRWEVELERLLRTQGSRTVVAVDPATTANQNSDETGIVAATRIPIDSDLTKPIMRAPADAFPETARSYDHGFVVADRSGIYSPTGWANEAIALYRELGAECIVGEANQGGEMVETVIHQIEPNVPVKLVWASKSKQARAEPKVALYEQGRIHHREVFELLESELTSWVPGEGGESPNRLDAEVWALEELFPSQHMPPAAVVAEETADLPPSPAEQIMSARW